MAVVRNSGHLWWLNQGRSKWVCFFGSENNGKLSTTDQIVVGSVCFCSPTNVLSRLFDGNIWECRPKPAQVKFSFAVAGCSPKASHCGESKGWCMCGCKPRMQQCLADVCFRRQRRPGDWARIWNGGFENEGYLTMVTYYGGLKIRQSLWKLKILKGLLKEK